jgi:hypothetical protein
MASSSGGGVFWRARRTWDEGRFFANDALVQGDVARMATSVARMVVDQWKAQGSIERCTVATRYGATDFSAEQNPEAGNRWQAAAVATSLSAQSEQQREGRAGGDIGTAVGKGKASEGVAPSRKVLVREYQAGNTANPMAGSEVQ